MRIITALFLLFLIGSWAACLHTGKKETTLHGTWQSLWQKDMTLQLELDAGKQFKVTLNRTDQTHTNIGWYDTEGNTFFIKDSVNYPLPVCNIADTGKYNFSIINDTLYFKVIEDKCERRSAALQLERFVRIK
ncbi:MAG: hypothetical protein J0I84_14180 [Terrimonas sp.]|nr:hypothetical protein [Terrimonas sp.]OJY96934.1 MAG: hypothetical protein BGP13_24960 [Sphingobacteriales bacterium 40-81]